MKNLNISVFTIIICLMMSLSSMAQIPDFQAKNESVASIITRLKQLSDFQFVYNKEEIDKCPPATFSLTNGTVEEVLTESLKNTELTFKQLNNTIVITPIQPELEDDKALTQTVRGTLIDSHSKIPLIGATVRILETDPVIGTLTNIDGKFRLEKIPVGRIDLQVSYVGFETITIPNLVVNSGKEVVLNISMKESVVKMEEIVVTANQNKGEALNDMVIVGARSVSAEETKRYAGGFSDPSRILTNFAGVTSSQNGENDVIVRGNSPKYIQWRLEGVEITNPTHFADQNAIKGGISALNNNLLSTSDFYTGAFSPEYGDVLSGVYDVRLRPGNNEKFEAAVGFGLLGTELTLEGPIKKENGGSFLANYRYSTIALISDLNIIDVEGALNYQDMTFKAVLPTSKMGTFSLFGLGGLSGFSLEDVDPDGQSIPGLNNVRSGIMKDHDKKTYLVNAGLNHTITLNPNSFLATSLTFSKTGANEDVFVRDSVSSTLDYINRSGISTYRGAMTYNYKFNANSNLQVGTKYALFDYDYDQSWLNELDNRFAVIDLRENASTVRNFVSWKYWLNEDVSIVTGVHNMNVLLNNKHTLEPRVAVNWQLTDNFAINAGYGNHSKMEKIHNYFTIVEQPDGSFTEPNKDLDLLKARHYVLGFEKRFSRNLMAKFEMYYQDLYSIPVENSDTSYYSTINEDVDFKFTDLVNEGTGKNYGVELTIERFFSNNYYFLINGSLYDSKYKTLEGIERNTQYNGNFLFNILSGKEFENLGRKNNQTLALNAKLFYGGGRKIIPLLRDEDGSLAVDVANENYLDYEKAYDHQLDNIFQLNLSASLKWNKPKATHELFLDLINVTNHVGRISEYYDETEPSNVGNVRQLGFFPNLMYRVYF